MQFNYKFGKLVERKHAKAEEAIFDLVYAPKHFTEYGILNPNEATYNKYGYKRLEFTSPTEDPGIGYQWVEDGYEDQGTKIVRTWKKVESVINYSVPKFMFWLRIYDAAHPDAPKGQKVMDWLNDNDLYAIALTTRVIASDHELFIPTLTAIKEQIGFTDADVVEACTYAKTYQPADEY